MDSFWQYASKQTRVNFYFFHKPWHVLYLWFAETFDLGDFVKKSWSRCRCNGWKMVGDQNKCSSWIIYEHAQAQAEIICPTLRNLPSIPPPQTFSWYFNRWVKTFVRSIKVRKWESCPVKSHGWQAADNTEVTHVHLKPHRHKRVQTTHWTRTGHLKTGLRQRYICNSFLLT